MQKFLGGVLNTGLYTLTCRINSEGRSRKIFLRARVRARFIYNTLHSDPQLLDDLFDLSLLRSLISNCASC